MPTDATAPTAKTPRPRNQRSRRAVIAALHVGT
jgi:hypothetical protein